jgi:hypothetical protein
MPPFLELTAQHSCLRTGNDHGKPARVRGCPRRNRDQLP